MNKFNSYRLSTLPRLNQAVRQLENEWLKEILEEELFPKYLQPIFSLCNRNTKGLCGSILLLSNESFGKTEQKLILSLAACAELLQTIFEIQDNGPNSRQNSSIPGLHYKISETLASRGQIRHEIEAEKIIHDLKDHLNNWLQERIIKISQNLGNFTLCATFAQYTTQSLRGQLTETIANTLSTNILPIKDLYASKTGAYVFCLPMVLGYSISRRSKSLSQELILEVMGENLGIVLQSQADLFGFGNQPAALQALRTSIINRQPSLWTALMLEALNEGESNFLKKIWKTQLITDADLYYLRYLFQKYDIGRIIKKAVLAESRLCRQLIRDLELNQEAAGLWYSLVDFVENGLEA